MMMKRTSYIFLYISKLFFSVLTWCLVWYMYQDSQINKNKLQGVWESELGISSHVLRKAVLWIGCSLLHWTQFLLAAADFQLLPCQTALCVSIHPPIHAIFVTLVHTHRTFTYICNSHQAPQLSSVRTARFTPYCAAQGFLSYAVRQVTGTQGACVICHIHQDVKAGKGGLGLWRDITAEGASVWHFIHDEPADWAERTREFMQICNLFFLKYFSRLRFPKRLCL